MVYNEGDFELGVDPVPQTKVLYLFRSISNKPITYENEFNLTNWEFTF